MAKGFLDHIIDQVLEETGRTGARVKNLKGTIADTALLPDVVHSQEWYVLRVPGTSLPSLREFLNRHTTERYPVGEADAVEGVATYPAGSNPLPDFVYGFVTEIDLSGPDVFELNVSASGCTYSVWIDGGQVGGGTVTGSSLIALTAGTYSLVVVVHGAITPIAVTLPVRIRARRTEGTPNAPIWTRDPIAQYLQPENGSFQVLLEWQNDYLAAEWNVYRSDGVPFLAPPTITLPNPNSAVFTYTTAVPELVLDYYIVTDTFRVGRITNVQEIRDGSNVVTSLIVTIELHPEAPDLLDDWVDRLFFASTDRYTAIARVAYAGTPAMSYTDSQTRGFTPYFYRLTALGLITASAESDYSRIAGVFVDDLTPPGDVTFVDPDDVLRVGESITINFTAPIDEDYHGVNVYKQSRAIFRYWKIQATTTFVGDWVLASLALHETIGGPNLITSAGMMSADGFTSALPNLIDGNLTTEWGILTVWNFDPHWVIVDLGVAREIREVVTQTAHGATWHGLHATQLDIFGSDDDITYTLVQQFFPVDADFVESGFNTYFIESSPELLQTLVATEPGLPGQLDAVTFQPESIDPGFDVVYRLRTFDWAGNIQRPIDGVTWLWDGVYGDTTRLLKTTLALTAEPGSNRYQLAINLFDPSPLTGAAYTVTLRWQGNITLTVTDPFTMTYGEVPMLYVTPPPFGDKNGRVTITISATDRISDSDAVDIPVLDRNTESPLRATIDFSALTASDTQALLSYTWPPSSLATYAQLFVQETSSDPGSAPAHVDTTGHTIPGGDLFRSQPVRTVTIDGMLAGNFLTITAVPYDELNRVGVRKSAAIQLTTPAGLPSPPADVRVTSGTTTETSVQNEVLLPVLNPTYAPFHLRAYVNNIPDTIVDLSGTGSVWVPISSYGLTPGVTYSFKYAIYNALGQSAYSSTLSVTTASPGALAVPDFTRTSGTIITSLPIQTCTFLITAGAGWPSGVVVDVERTVPTPVEWLTARYPGSFTLNFIADSVGYSVTLRARAYAPSGATSSYVTLGAFNIPAYP